MLLLWRIDALLAQPFHACHAAADQSTLSAAPLFLPTHPNLVVQQPRALADRVSAHVLELLGEHVLLILGKHREQGA